MKMISESLFIKLPKIEDFENRIKKGFNLMPKEDILNLIEENKKNRWIITKNIFNLITMLLCIFAIIGYILDNKSFSGIFVLLVIVMGTMKFTKIE